VKEVASLVGDGGHPARIVERGAGEKHYADFLGIPDYDVLLGIHRASQYCRE
jgi:hypothetical protein